MTVDRVLAQKYARGHPAQCRRIVFLPGHAFLRARCLLHAGHEGPCR